MRPCTEVAAPEPTHSRSSCIFVMSRFVLGPSYNLTASSAQPEQMYYGVRNPLCTFSPMPLGSPI